ncbi:MAG: MBL fold metallo-hydrolase [Anaerolineae bacterium]|nr:MBL fold metallo-hydrolase [Anaerolineae bacterium]
MSVKEIVPGVYGIGLGGVNVFLVEADDGLVLIDAGMPNRDTQILSALRDLSRKPEEVRYILVTHAHVDHVGGLAALKKATGAITMAHPVTATDLREGLSQRPISPAPGLANKLIYNLLLKNATPSRAESFVIDREVNDGEVVAGGLTVVHTPGHTAGHLSYLWPRHGGVLFIGDAAAAFFRLGYPPLFEDFEEGKHTLAKIGKMDFQVACLAHGQAIMKDAPARFREKWG